MPDREKVIKGIDICLQRFRCGEDCPYYNYEKIGCMEQLREDALELLKEQENELTNEEALRFIEKLKSDNNELRKKYFAMLKEQDVKEQISDAIHETAKQFRQTIVRCKDCKKRNSWECWQYFFGRIKIPDDWFCADGEKRDKNA